MATARPNNFAIASGASLVFGRSSGWWDGKPANSFYEIPDSSLAAAVAPLLTDTDFIGSDNPAEFANAFSCSALSQDGTHGHWCGVAGHTNNSQNGSWDRDYTTLGVRMMQRPTPTADYPPGFRIPGSNQPGPIVYPSGVNRGRFCTQDELTDPLDAGWGAPFQAPSARHMYQSAILDRNGRVQAFYAKHSIFNTVSGLWEKCGFDDFGPKLAAIFPDYGDVPLGEGTSSVYDPVTHRIVVTVVQGSNGGAWRHGMVVVDAATGNILWNKQGEPIAPCALVRVGRWVYGFSSADARKGWRYSLDAGDPATPGAFQWIQFQGDTFTQPPTTLTFEQIPHCHHQARGTVMRWDYVNNRAALFEVDPAAVGGSGALATPYLLQQTRRAIAGTPPPKVTLNYQLIYHQPSQAVIFEPDATSNLFAVGMQ